MDQKFFLKEALGFVDRQQYVTVGTTNRSHRPHASLKMVLSAQDRTVFLVDYMAGRTYKNLLQNPYVSISSFDIQNMIGYHLYGKISLITAESKHYRECFESWEARQIRMATDKVVDRVRNNKQTKSLNMAFLKPRFFYKVKANSAEKVEAVALE